MPETFNEENFKRKLINGGVEPATATAVAARTAAARRDSGNEKGAFFAAADLFPLPSPVQPAANQATPASQSVSATTSRRRTVIEDVADHVSGLSSEQQKASMATKKPSKTATDALAGSVEQAQQAAMLKHTKEQIKTLQLSLFDIAPWPDHMRAMPNDFARSALFTVRNKRTPRADLKNEVIFHLMKDVQITYTGPELRAYDDELVWLQVMEYAKRVPVGEPVTFTLYEFCKDLGWPINGQYYDRVEDCLTRLQTTALKFSSKRVGRLESLSLIRRFGFLDQTKKRQSRCQVLLEDEIVLLFAGEHYARFIWEKYRKLSAITRRMFDYFSSHRDPHPLTLDNFRLMCKSESTLAKKWREQANSSCVELCKSGLVKNVWMKDDQVHCDR